MFTVLFSREKKRFTCVESWFEPHTVNVSTSAATAPSLALLLSVPPVERWAVDYGCCWSSGGFPLIPARPCVQLSAWKQAAGIYQSTQKCRLVRLGDKNKRLVTHLWRYYLFYLVPDISVSPRSVHLSHLVHFLLFPVKYVSLVANGWTRWRRVRSKNSGQFFLTSNSIREPFVDFNFKSLCRLFRWNWRNWTQPRMKSIGSKQNLT